MVSTRPRLRVRRRIAAALALAVTAVLPAATGAQVAQGSVRGADATGGYWMVASDGGIFSFGSAQFYGSTGDIRLNQPIVGIAGTPSGNGYWMVATDGGIFTFGDARFFGSTGNITLNRPIVGMASTPTGNGYWLVASDGGIFAFGDARFFGSTGDVKLNKPIVGMAATPSGNGYWFVASDGGIFSFGDAKFYGSGGSGRSAAITGMAASPSGRGYWFTAADGSIFNFGDARYFGAAASRPAPAGGRTVAAVVPTADGTGYWQASSSGEVLNFGGATALGGLTGRLARPIVGMTAAPAPQISVAATPGGAEPTGTDRTTTTPNPAGGTTPTSATPATTGPGSPTTTTTVPPTTTTTTSPVPPGPSGPVAFSSTAKQSWGTPSDPGRPFVNSMGETTYPYSQKVSAITEIGGRVYIGGEFTDLVDPGRRASGVPMAYLAELDSNGFPVPGSTFNATARLNGAVRVLFRSPDGRRLYVGGVFSTVNGETRRRLVALDPTTGQIDRSFNPPEPSGAVTSITQFGSRLYIAGSFNSLGAVSQPVLAALDAATGALDRGFMLPPRYPGRFEGHTGKRVDDPITNGDKAGVITSILVTPDGKHLLVGGTFLHFGTDHAADPEHRRGGLVALDPVSGNLTSWQPEWGKNSSRPVFSLTLYPGDPKSIGVNAPALVFTAAGGAGGKVVAWTPGATKTTPLWKGSVDGDTLSVVSTRERVYLVGHYDHVVLNPDDACLKPHDLGNGTVGVSCPDGMANRHLAAFDVRGERDENGKNTGQAIIDPTFTAQADTPEGPYVAFIGANQLYVGGNFSKLTPTSGGSRVNQPGFAIFPALP